MTHTFWKFAAVSVVGVALAAGGCASDDIGEIPTSAVQMGDARGPLTVTAPQEGMIYIYDTSNNQLVYSGKVDSGDLVKMDTDEKDVLINGRKVASNALIHDHRHQVFFEKMPGRTVIERQTTVVEPASPHTTVVTPAPSSDSSRTTVVTPAPSDETRQTTVVGPDGKRTTVITPAPEQRDTTIITTPRR